MLPPTNGKIRLQFHMAAGEGETGGTTAGLELRLDARCLPASGVGPEKRKLGGGKFYPATHDPCLHKL